VESSTTLSSSVKPKSSSYRNSLYNTHRVVMGDKNSHTTQLDRKIEMVTHGLQPFYKKILKERLSDKNVAIVCDYIISNKRQNNVGIHNVKLKIQTLVNFSEFIGMHKVLSKEFRDITKDDVHMFIERYRKDEKDDPLHKWVLLS
jgi:hypothetical protein